jgi:dihydrofolate reductase
MIGSGELFNSLLQHNMIDELQLMVCPVVLGIGKRLFIEGTAPRSMKLTGTRSYDSGMVALDYELVQKL